MAYSNAIFYLDYINGIDTARATINTCIASNPGGTTTNIYKVGHGLVTGAVVTLSNFTAWLNATWKVTRVDADNFTLDTAVWQATADASGDCVPFGGSSWADAWKTLTTGVTAARIAPTDTVRIAKSPDPTLVGNAKWTNTTKANGGIDSTVFITSSTNASPVQITKSAHGLSSGDVVQIKAHTTNTNANGVWIITVDGANTFTLDNSVGNGVGGASGTYQRVTPHCIVLETAVTKTITNAEFAWTPGTNVTSAGIDATSLVRQHLSSLKVVTGASCGANQIIAKYALPASLDLSGFEQISFWIKNDTTVLIAGQLEVRLYSDGACTSLVETFAVPALPVSYYMAPFTINKGSALSSGVQGIAIYATVALASKTYRFDNFIACKAASSADSLSLCSLISKSSAATGGQWFCIQSIDDKIIVLDNQLSANPFIAMARGYVGETESSVATYKRETIKTPMPAGNNTNVEVLNDTGSVSTGLVTYEAGYNISNSARDGETFLDGLCGFGVGLNTNGKGYSALKYFSFVRYYDGIYVYGTMINLDLSQLINCTDAGIKFSSSYQITAVFGSIVQNTVGIYLTTTIGFNCSSIGYLDSNKTYGLLVQGLAFSRFDNIGSASNNTTAFDCTNLIDAVFQEIVMAKCNSTSVCTIYGGSNIIINKVETTLNYSLFGCVSGGDIVIRNLLCTETVTAATVTNPMQNNRLFYHNVGRTGSTHYIFSDGCYAVTDATTRHTASGLSWCLNLTANTRISTYPLRVPVAKVAVNASALVTVTLWFKLSHATNVGAKLFVRKNQINGVASDVEVIASDTTNWQQLTMTFTPTEAGVIEIEAQAYCRSALYPYSVYIDDITISQA